MAEQKPAGQADPEPAKVDAVKPAEKSAETPAGAKPAGTDGAVKPEPEKPADVKPAGAPEKYALTVPAGSETWLDTTDVQALEVSARAKGWTNEQAQAAIDQQADARAAMSAQFRTETEADPIYGGDHLTETQRLATLALDKVRPAGTPAGDGIRRLLAKTGYGNHLQVVSMLADLGKLMAEDKPAGGGGGGAKHRDAATVLYGKT